ncbi:hypothetical protein D3C71_23100 [compost metagenome]
MQNVELESLGILRQTRVPHELDWMTDDEKRFMLVLLEAGEYGLHKRVVLKEEKQKKQEHLSLRLSAHGLAYWARDRNGREMFFTITPKGEDIAATLLRIARNASKVAIREQQEQKNRAHSAQPHPPVTVPSDAAAA